jgi:hypothetical protein
VIRKVRLHRKAATAVFFESNGGQARAEATIPEVRLAIGEPGLDIGNVETVLEALGASCYYLSVERNRYKFGLSPNLNKLLADRRASVAPAKIEERTSTEVQKVFAAGTGLERVFFPERSNQIPDRPVLTVVVLSPDQANRDEATTRAIEGMTRQYGNSARTFKSALLWCVPDSPTALRDEARNLLAWEDIRDDAGALRLDDGQQRQLAENLKKAQRDLREAVWRTYKNIKLLDKHNALRDVDLGLVHSSAADTMLTLIVNRLSQEGDIEAGIGPNFPLRNWPPAFTEWSTKAVRDAFFAAPQFPRLLNSEVIKATIARGVEGGQLAYVGKAGAGEYRPFSYRDGLKADDVEISEDMFIITREVADVYRQRREQSATPPTGVGPGGSDAHEPGPTPGAPRTDNDMPYTGTTSKAAQPRAIAKDGPPIAAKPISAASLAWEGDIPPQKWMNFYAKVLTKFVGGKGLKLTLRVHVAPEEGLSLQKIEETRVALRELGLDDKVTITDVR